MSLVEARTFLVAPRISAAWSRLAPSIALGLGVYLVLICAGSQLLNDPDTQWHVAIGRWILANDRVPTTDLFSHTFYGAPWIAKEWGAQLVLSAFYRLAGWSGVVVMAAASIAASFALLHAWLQARLRAAIALALTLVTVLLCAPHLLARPHALVLPVMLVWAFQLVAARERETAPPLWLVLVMVLWANLHGSFPLGLMLAGVLAGEGVVFGKAGTLSTRLREWTLFLASAGAATFATPYGWRALLVPLQMAGANGEALPFIGEWQRLGLDLNGVLAMGLCAFALWALATPRTNLFRIAATLVLAVMMIRHSRFVDQFALLVPVLIASALARRLGFAPAPEARPSRAALCLAAALGLAACVATARAAPEPDPRMTPEGALKAARAAGLTGPVYNDYDFGGFLIAHGVPTFIDGRTDQLFLGGFLTALDKARQDRADDAFAALLGRHRVTWALVRPQSAEARHLGRLPGWAKLYIDEDAAVFARQ